MATAAPGSVARTGNAYVDSLLWGDAWDQSTGPITYDLWQDGDSLAWTGIEKIAFRTALSSYAAVANLSFREASNEPTDLNFLLVDLEPGTYAIQGGPNGGPYEGLGGYDRSTFSDWFGQLKPGGFAYSVIVHELGHALGLAHPHDRAGTSTIFPGVTPNDPWDTGAYGLNTWLNTLMSYNNKGHWWAPDGEEASGFVAGPMALDIAAIQHIYGANMSFHTGSDTYTLPGSDRIGTAYRCIWDAGGVDTIAFSGSAPVTIDLRAAPLVGANAGGYLSRAEGVHGGFTIANGVVIERAFGGSGDDRLIGNDAANLLSGGRGADRMAGGRGNDTYMVDDAGDRIQESATGGVDTVRAAVDFTLGSHLEQLVLTGSATVGTGNSLANRLFGGRTANTLDGAAGDDVLDGGDDDDLLLGDAGADMLIGGAGGDRLYGGSGFDTVSYQGSAKAVAVNLHRGSGSGGDAAGDRIASVEALLGSGRDDVLVGGDGRDRIGGDAGDDVVYGGNGHDVLVGGVGRDRLYGGNGQDSLTGEADDDRLYGGEGRLLAFGGLGDDRLYGGGDLDRLYGGEGLDAIYAGGGADRLFGGAGIGYLYGGDDDDLLYGEVAADRLFGGNGDDLLRGGDGNDGLAGGVGADTLWGGSGDDRLDGGGGRDTLDGGHGDDRLYAGDGRSLLQGGTGIDVAVLTAARAACNIDRSDPARVIVRHGSDTVTLVDVEYLRFTDASVSNVNHAPGVIGDADRAANRVTEGVLAGTAVGITAASLDLDGDTVTYRLLDDADGRFRIDRSSGVVTVADRRGLDHEAQDSHTIAVRASDRYGLFVDRAFSIAVDDAAEPPGAIADADPTDDAIREDAAGGSGTGLTATATDPDGAPIGYSLVVDAGGRFVIDAATGIVSVAGSAVFDHESSPQHVVRVRATDADGLAVERDFLIAVRDVNEAPTALVDIDPAADAVAESATAGAPVGITASAFDPDGDLLAFSLTDDAAGLFAIDAATGAVSVADAGLLDFETATTHRIGIRAADPYGAAIEAFFTLAVLDVTEPML